MEWLSENWGTLAVLAVICAAVFFIMRKIIRDRKRGECGCGCSECSMRGSCRDRTSGQ